MCDEGERANEFCDDNYSDFDYTDAAACKTAANGTCANIGPGVSFVDENNFPGCYCDYECVEENAVNAFCETHYARNGHADAAACKTAANGSCTNIGFGMSYNSPNCECE